MKMSHALVPPVGTFAWPPECTISAAAALHASLLMLLAEDPAPQGDIVLDLGQVTDVDSSAIQLLLALQRSVTQHGRRLLVAKASDPVQDALLLFGLGDLLPESSTTA